MFLLKTSLILISHSVSDTGAAGLVSFSVLQYFQWSSWANFPGPSASNPYQCLPLDSAVCLGCGLLPKIQIHSFIQHVLNARYQWHIVNFNSEWEKHWVEKWLMKESASLNGCREACEKIWELSRLWTYLEGTTKSLLIHWGVEDRNQECPQRF